MDELSLTTLAEMAAMAALAGAVLDTFMCYVYIPAVNKIARNIDGKHVNTVSFPILEYW